MTTILLECPECGGDAEGRVADSDFAGKGSDDGGSDDGGSESVLYSCEHGCEGVLVAAH